jgi:2-methylcitrate dehydratase PrpD
MSIIGDLARFVREASAATLPQRDRDQLRRHVGDAAIAGIAGARTSEAKHLRALDPNARGFEAIAIAASIIRHTEVDDIHLESCTTPSSVTVPVALMLARAAGVTDPDRIASAIWAGTDLIVRLGVAINGPVILYRGIWPTAIGAPLGAAAVAARIWGLDQKQAEAALSLALMMTAGRAGRFTGALSGRWVLFIGAIAEGLRAAHAARLGFCGDASLLDGPWLENAQGLKTDMEKLLNGLGKTSVFPLLSMKPFCTARQALGATEAFISLLDSGLDPDTIESVKVRVPQAYAGMISGAIDPASRSTGFVNAGFQMGLAAFQHAHLWDLDRMAIMGNRKVLDFASRVSVEPDASLQQLFPKQWPASIEVTAGGKVVTRKIETVSGDPDKPLDDAALATKAHRILDPLVGPTEAERLIATAHGGLNDPAACAALCDAFAAVMD